MILKVFLWLGFFSSLFILEYHSFEFSRHAVDNLVDLTFADQVKAKEILLSWQYIKVPAGSLLDTARTIIRWDYLFILFYVVLLIKLSHDYMNRESWYPLNVLLRLNLLITVLAGLIDGVENSILLYNLDQWPSLEYARTIWFTVPKFLLAGWALLVLLVSIIKLNIQKSA